MHTSLTVLPTRAPNRSASGRSPTAGAKPRVPDVREREARAMSLVRSLSAFGPMSEQDRHAVLSLGHLAREHEAGDELCKSGELPAPRALIDGWACREAVLSDGRRQIISFLLPGDLIGVFPGPRQASYASIVALTPGTTVDAKLLRQAALCGVGQPRDDHTGLTSALHAHRAMEEILLHTQVVRLGRQTAYERLAHLLLEIHHRLSMVHMTNANQFNMPLTQEIVAAALGLSSVHMNRTLQRMRREKMLVWRHGHVALLRRDELVELADWSRPMTMRSH